MTTRNITVFFRGSDASQRVVSSTQATLSNDIKKAAMISFINLEKRNYEKYFKTNQVDVAYLWHDEEIVIDFIKKQYPNVVIELFSNHDSVKYNKEYLYGKREYLLSDRIYNDLSKFLGNVTKWTIEHTIDKSDPFRVEPIIISLLNISDVDNRRIFDSKEKAINYEIEDTTDRIERAKKTVITLEKELLILKKMKLSILKKKDVDKNEQ